MQDLLNKFLGMNSGTRERTIVAIVVYILDFLVVFDIVSFSNEQIEAIAHVVVLIATAIAWYCSHYMNNDYSEEGCIGTGITRQLKREKNEKYIGDFFYEDAVQEYVEEEPDYPLNTNADLEEKEDE